MAVTYADACSRHPDRLRHVGLCPSLKEIKKPRLNSRGIIDMAVTYSPACWCSTIGHEGLNFSVRYVKR